MTAEAPSLRRRFLRFGAADLVFVFFALAILQRSGSGMLDDPGLGWQIRIADAMAEQGGFVHADPFGGATKGEPWLPFGWIGPVLLRFAEGWGGLDALAVLGALTIAFLLRCLYRMLVADGVPPIQAFAWTFLAALGVSSAWVVRPNLFTLVFTLVTARVCVQWHGDRISRGKTLWLIPLFVVWANAHGGFVGGGLTIAGAGLAELGLAFYDPAARSAALARFRWLVILGVGCLLATFVNPYGPMLHAQILRLMGDSYMMNLNDDWLSPDFHSRGAFRLELLILLLPLLLAWSRQRPDVVSLVLCVVWLHMGLNGRRYSPIWVLIAVPMMARLAASLPAVERLGAWLNETRPDLVPPVSPPTRRAPWIWSAVIALLLFVSTRYVGGYGRHHPDNMPTQALDTLLDEYHGEPVFHSINWGGYLIWHGWDRDPRFKAWIDDRNELHGRERTEEWRTLSAALPGWREKLDRLGIRTVCVEADSGLALRLAEEPGWTKTYADSSAVIYRRIKTSE